MERMTVLSRVGADGILHVSVPVGVTDANRPVQVTIEPADDRPNSASEYEVWLEGLSGRWQGEFLRGNEGIFETREPLS